MQAATPSIGVILIERLGANGTLGVLVALGSIDIQD